MVDILSVYVPVRYWALINAVIRDPVFYKAPASTNHHHSYNGGLRTHTEEVMKILHTWLNSFEIYSRDIESSDYIALFLAALYHDVGKTVVYYQKDDGSWDKKHKLCHVEQSLNIFQENWDLVTDKDPVLYDKIYHAIKYHHGVYLSYGLPETFAEIFLHHADMQSAFFGATK